MAWQLYQGDALETLKQMEDESINCCVTSPPYWGLRDYGCDGQMGLESSPDEYVSKMVEVFREVKRVLRKDGTLWLNLGDSYANNSGNTGNNPSNKSTLTTNGGKGPKPGDKYSAENTGTKIIREHGLKHKDLVGIPWRLAFALQADGWYLRSDIIWSKPNPMPESVQDRPTKAHEYIFLLTKSERYYYDADSIREPLSEQRAKQAGKLVDPGNDAKKRKKQIEHDKKRGSGGHFDGHKWRMNPLGRNKRSVWTVATKPFPEAHFATFPPELPEICIKAGCPEGGLVLDPFAGAGTTLYVAEQLGRNSIGIELNPEYCEIMRRRMAGLEMNLFQIQ
jgi:DNA modification methylase